MNKGSSQDKRIQQALSNSYLSIDGRSVLEKLIQTLEFAGHLPFVDTDNKIVGNWKTFLMRDPLFVIASIVKIDLDEFKNLAKENELINDQSAQNKRLTEANRLMRDLVIRWLRGLKNSGYSGALLSELENIYSSVIHFEEESPDRHAETISEHFENLYGHLLFLQEKAAVYFKAELEHAGHQPHIALLLAFFRLTEFAQADMNALPQEHLDFYYKKILQQSPRNQTHSNAILGLKLQQGIEFKDIPENEVFHLTFPNGPSYPFKTGSASRFTQTEITEIKTLFKSDYHPFGESDQNNNFSINLLYQNDIRSNGKNTVENDKVLPATFGEEKTMLNEAVVPSKIGILFSSPALILEKGNQTAILSLKFTSESWQESRSLFDGLIYDEIIETQDKAESVKFRDKIVSQFFAEAFQLLVTSHEGWVEPEHVKVQINREKHSLIITIPFTDQEQTLIPFTPEIHDGDYDTTWPCIKVMLNNNARYHPYRILSQMVMEEVMLETEVAEVSDLMLSTSLGNLDSSIPFAPFGTAPVLGSYLKIQNPLVLQQNLSELDIKINWLGLPRMKGGFSSYYRGYPLDVSNDGFRFKIKQSSQSNDRSGIKMQEEKLFNTKDNYLEPSTEINVALGNLNFDQQINPLGNKKLPSLLLELSGPEFAFGHQQFPEIYANAALNRSRFKRNTDPLPSQPFTPMVEKLTLRYKNVAREIMHRKLDNKSADIKIVHIHPFGKVQVFPGPVKSQSYFLPQITGKGSLLLGLEKVTPNEILNLGFDLQPAVYSHTVIKPPRVEWHYLSNNEWISMHNDILEDGTQGLLKSGIIRLKLPGIIQTDNPRMPKGKFWLKASYKKSPDNNSRIRHVFSQALQVVSSENLEPDNTQSGKQQKHQKASFSSKPGIAEIKGPFALEATNKQDSEALFYGRTGEMLRHKNRAVSNWDIEQLVLDRFPQVEKVRAYGRNTHPKELVKGSNLQIVLIPKTDSETTGSQQSHKIDYSTLVNVKQYISQFLSPWVKVEVANPIYELLKIRCTVKFKDPFKAGYLKTALNRELVNYLSPGVKNESTDKGFDESFSKTELINFIESRPYVEFVTGFSVLQLVEVLGRYKIIDTAIIERINDLRTISPYAILTSAPEHQITVIGDEDAHKPQKSGIGDLAVEADFVISDGKGNYT
ncbi:hypothetical protein D1614_00725 [Maribellus luteus]|uniref:Baseplate protein J-like domain-containing protein n=1 Tax=Maribellus luteus TaxID=2305463 RepID=A0A399T6Q6_9BACT|nr:hypothetical protein [Maribellus luteus]RIJ50492.1 hypothetical protein D1614_00725 [Maribellus luteus]